MQRFGSRWTKIFTSLLPLLIIQATAFGETPPTISNLQASYNYLVNLQAHGGALYKATAYNGQLLALSYYDSPEYWEQYVCDLPVNKCPVVDTYNPLNYQVNPSADASGDLQYERVDVHNGQDIYDAATWQIAVMLGHVHNGFSTPSGLDAYSLAQGQNTLLTNGYDGNDANKTPGANRGVTNGQTFLYNNNAITNPMNAFYFRMVTQNWLSIDPLSGLKDPAGQDYITAIDLPSNPDYQPGKVTWADWKPITGENSWAFLIGPLQSAYLNYIKDKNQSYIPFTDASVQNAINVLPAFAAMQSQLGAIYYAPAGTYGNSGSSLVNPYEVSVENNVSAYAGLTILQAVLNEELKNQSGLTSAQQAEIDLALNRINVILNGNDKTHGMLSFLQNDAWQNGAFIQGGLANEPNHPVWQPMLDPKAVDVTTWGISSITPEQLDKWHNFGASYQAWQYVKSWGGYGVGNSLWGVGYSDEDGNGIDTTTGAYKQGILSTEWTAGAVNAVRSMEQYYGAIPESSPNYTAAQQYKSSLEVDENSMLINVQKLQFSQYAVNNFPDSPGANYTDLLPNETYQPYLYASKRYFIPFGWFANPLPSICSTSWMIMLADNFNPFVYGGGQ